MPKFKYNRRCIEELGKILDEEIKPLINIALYTVIAYISVSDFWKGITYAE